MKHKYQKIILFFLYLIFSERVCAFSKAELQPILAYIKQQNTSLLRSVWNCESYDQMEQRILYVPQGISIPTNIQNIQRDCKLSLKVLPVKINTLGQIDQSLLSNGLLYLPHHYIVPGGMFNEMYGWDSYFIILGLLKAEQPALVKDMIENFFFEIEHYGAVLNANRAYSLTRSQPPLLSSMIVNYYQYLQNNQNEDTKWLAVAYEFAKKDFEFWTTGKHLAGDTGLSRYYDFGAHGVPELIGKHYYSDIVELFKKDPLLTKKYLNYNAKHSLQLSEKFYHGDRAMRESGFDTSFRFGPFSADTDDYAPVCLNALLYKTANDLEWMSIQLGKFADAKFWNERKKTLQVLINKYLWDEKKGLFFDYNFVTQDRSQYIYATTYYPLWVKLASYHQAAALEKNIILLEKPGGVLSSPYVTEVQWDAPYGWAPLQLITIEGLQNYGYKKTGLRLANKFLTLVMNEFTKSHHIYEKYDVVALTSHTHIKYGYLENMTGFGWTNGVFLALLDLTQPERALCRLAVTSDEI